jgi:hypothetical protein
VGPVFNGLESKHIFALTPEMGPTAVSETSSTNVQGGSNMTGTICV